MARPKSTPKSTPSSSRASSRVATRKSGPTNNAKSSSRVIKPSRVTEVLDSDPYDEIAPPPARGRPSFQGVVIPRKVTDPPARPSKISSGATSSIADSAETSDYETPITSAGITPTEVKRPAKVSASARALELRQSALALGSSKNKRRRTTYGGEDSDDIESDEEDADAKFARKLQAHEYGVDPDSSPIRFPTTKRQRRALFDKVCGNADMFDLESDSNDELRLSFRGPGFVKKSESTDEAPIASRRNRKAVSYRSSELNNVPGFEDEAPLASHDIYEDVFFTGSEMREIFKEQDKARGASHETGEVKFYTAADIREMCKADNDAQSSNLTSLTATDEDSFVDDDDDESSTAESDNSDSQDLANQANITVAPPPRRRAWGRNRRGNNVGYNPSKSRAERERQKLEKMHPEILTMWSTLEKVQPIKPVPAEQPTGISRKLKSFQLEGLNWMIQQEQTEFRGGLLGDEMGMGKTIQAVSLIMSDYPAKSPTLVVVPPVALMQWQAEINAYTGGKLKVLVYHISANPKCKHLTVPQLKKYDVIMVSYSSLESMYRKENKGWNRGDGIVKEDSILHAIKYHRLILDEAHSIKQRTTGVAKACFAMRANYKWCLSGTPVQNRIGEFFSLLRFLELKPFACYFCKQCKCQELHWSQDEHKMCTHCKHSGFNHVSVFNQEILNPITTGETTIERQQGFNKLRLITDRIMLRRMKRDHTSSMELPPKDVIIHNEFFGEIERDFSQSIMSNTQRKFDTYVAQGVMLNNYANIFGLIMQMRQIANHPDLILRRKAEGGQNILVCSICDEPAEEAIRSRCRHDFCRQCAKSYVRSFDGDGSEADCPQCHIPLSIDWDQPDIEQDEENVKKSSIINRIKMEDWTSSTKIEMLVYDLFKLRSKKQTHKSIVFSQFTSMLQLVQWRLQKSGFNTVLLDGSMSPAQRQKSIEYFMNNVDVEVFLVSLKAGGVALNLTEASRVFIIDPWWNPAAEWQSADRCHRIGQRRPCVITRLVIEDSVESRMVLLQEKKANMISATVNSDSVAMDKLTPEDMQFLFRG